MAILRSSICTHSEAFGTATQITGGGVTLRARRCEAAYGLPRWAPRAQHGRAGELSQGQASAARRGQGEAQLKLPRWKL